MDKSPAQQTTSYKVYVALGFHTSFHHSWRGDTPDEGGFGMDIRVVREIIGTLNQANNEGLQARGYWDFDVYWTLQEIIPRHAPDIIEGIRQRVQAGQDEIVLGYYNNGANHAATERELRTAISYAIENPYGSGLRQIFGRVSSILRPQESMYTTGQNAILLDEGVSGLVLYYAGIPFNALSTFIPRLPPEKRYNPLWMRSYPGEEPIMLWPCISLGDIVDHISLEALLLELRRLQISGQVKSDLLVHVNFDADSDAWLPVKIPKAFSWFPNTGGLREYIQLVNRYPWAEFTVLTEYMQDHPPRGEVLVRQDLADGAFDGNYSWAEKHTSLSNWTLLERSRLHTYRAEALSRRIPASLAREISQRLWQGPGSAFFQRLVGLTTTHFGMSTPVINAERQRKAEGILGQACQRALQAEKDAAQAFRDMQSVENDTLYVIEVYPPFAGGKWSMGKTRAVVRIPFVLPPGVRNIRMESGQGEQVPVSLVNVEGLLDGSLAGEMIFVDEFGPGDTRTYRVESTPVTGNAPEICQRLSNPWLDVRLSRENGIDSLTYFDQEIGSDGFLMPFISYGERDSPHSYFPSGYRFVDLSDERWDGLSRARIQTQINVETPHGVSSSAVEYTVSLFDVLPYMLVDVKVDFASTASQDTITSIQQKLHRLLDLRWIEVAPIQLNPRIVAEADRPLRIWKANYLGAVSYYELDYGQINPRNKNLDSFNHQITAGWVAVSDGQFGLLLAENADFLASMAFCPMRLREVDGRQSISLNPFGSYYGHQLDYTHLGGKGIGAEITRAVSGSLRPNAPSFNGESLSFSLLVAPYAGDAPPEELQADAQAYFYPMGVVYLRTPAHLEAVVPDDMIRLVAEDKRKRQHISQPHLSPPAGFVVNPSDQTAELVWEASRDVRVTGYEIGWQEVGEAIWHEQRIPGVSHWQIPGLRNRQSYKFRMRAIGEGRHSEWTGEVEVVPGAVPVESLFSAVPQISPWTLVRMVGYSLAHVFTARMRRL